MKRILGILILVTLSLSIQAQSISYIETTKGWYYIYDQSGKRIKTISSSQGELVGYSSNFYIIKLISGFYVTYDATGKRDLYLEQRRKEDFYKISKIKQQHPLFSYPRSMVSYHASFIILFCLVSFLTLHQQIIKE